MSIRRFAGSVFMLSTMALPTAQSPYKKPVIAQTDSIVACAHERKIYYDLRANGYGLDMVAEFNTSRIPKRAFVADDIERDNYFINLHLKTRPSIVTFVPRDSKTFDTFSEEYTLINPENGQRKPF